MELNNVADKYAVYVYLFNTSGHIHTSWKYFLNSLLRYIFVTMSLLSNQVTSLFFKNQRNNLLKYKHSRILNLNFLRLPGITRIRVTNDVYLYLVRKPIKKLMTLYMRHKGIETIQCWESRNGFCKTRQSWKC